MEESGNDFFRREALDAANAGLGRPTKTAGLANWAIVLLLGSLLFVTAVFLGSASYTRKETVAGTLTPTRGSVRIAVSRAGVISAVSIQDGELVRAGQPLITISTDAVVSGGQAISTLLADAALRENTATSMQSAAQRDAVAHQEQDITAQRVGLEAERQRLQADLVLQQRRVTLAEETVEASRSIFKKGFLSALSMREREVAVIAAKQALSATEGQIVANHTQATQLIAARGQAETSLRRAYAERDIARAELSAKQAAVARDKSVVLTAVRDGRVAGLQVRLGEPVRPEQTLGVILPRGAALNAELWVPSRAIGFIRVGNPVRLMLDAFPYQRFGALRGAVSYVSRVPVDPQDQPIPTQNAEPLFRVLVRLDRQAARAYGQTWALSPGMRLQADVVLERRSLFEWLLDPLLAIKHRGGEAA